MLQDLLLSMVCLDLINQNQLPKTYLKLLIFVPTDFFFLLLEPLIRPPSYLISPAPVSFLPPFFKVD